VRTSPCTPQWQRKLEVPLRVVISCINQHRETEGKKLVILWKSLTLMSPSDERDFSADHTAYARLFYEESSGSFVGRLEITEELGNILASPPTLVGAKEGSLWEQQWNALVWGSQWEYDEAERETFQRAKVSGHTAGKGSQAGKGRKHWSQALLHNSWFSPFPFELSLRTVEAVAFVWDEYCDKCNREDEKIGSYEIATYAGKPAAPQQDVEMAQASAGAGPHSSATPSEAMPKGKGRGTKGAKGS